MNHDPVDCYDPDSDDVCSICNKRKAIKSGDAGPECRKCAMGLPDPYVHACRFGRNQKCPCGKGKKFKSCCMKKLVAPTNLK